MDWKAVCCLVLALPLLIQVNGQPLSTPVVLSKNQENFLTSLVLPAVLTCYIENLGSYRLNWVFVKHSTVIFHGSLRMVEDSRYSLAHPPDSNKYQLFISNPNIRDQGVYKCQVEGTDQAGLIDLGISSSEVTPGEGIPEQPLNVTACCNQRRVSAACLPACNPSAASTATNFTEACVADLPSLIYCGSDGRNHENCCAKSGVPADCLYLCSNDPIGMSQSSSDQNHCINYSDTIISCYQFGGARIPTAPQKLSVLMVSRNGSHHVVVNWKQPEFNPSAVSGYVVYYKKSSDPVYKASNHLNAGTYSWSQTVDVNSRYSFYAVAVGYHGSSQPSTTIDIITEDNTPPGHAKDVLACCKARKVSSPCQSALCHPHLWQTFNTSAMIQCYSSLDSVFTCLAGERDNTGCCALNNVPDPCLGICSGQPPAFNQSLAICVPKLSVIEACIQRGLSSQPSPPQALTVERVDAHMAVLSWTAPSGVTPEAYEVQIRRGNENSAWETVLEVVGTGMLLRNLSETEHYAVRLISKANGSSSLPSATASFKTYPESFDSEERPTIAHNISKCCLDSGMPAECAQGCQYMANMTAYFATRLPLCMAHIGTVLTCASDGRDHTSCCRDRGVQEVCHELCVFNNPGSLDLKHVTCMADTGTIVMCYQEGLEDLVRMPEDVMVTNISSSTVTLSWKSPETGPKPQNYVVEYTNLVTGDHKNETTTKQIHILQNLSPASQYSITVTSRLNGTASPPTQAVTAFTPSVGSVSPFFPNPPNDASRALWNNQTHCCNSGDISQACKPLCLNKPTANATECSKEDHNILTCAGDGKNHSLCCQENGLPAECLPYCAGRFSTDFTVRLAGCMADANLNIITSCFLSNTGLLPSVPYSFNARADIGPNVTLSWTTAVPCEPTCTYDVHYWRATTSHANGYVTKPNVISPYVVTGLDGGRKYVFTVTARNSKGSGPAAPWQTFYVGSLMPSVSIAQSPMTDVHEEGDNVALTCDAFNFREQPTFTWQLREKVLPGETYRILRLQQVRQGSEGNYTCTASTPDAVRSAVSYVNVRFRPVFDYFRTDTVHPNIGAEAVLACWFKGHPLTNDPYSIWTHYGRPLARSSRHAASAKPRYHTGITAFKVKIANLQLSDYGTYQCNVSNKFGYAVASTKLMDPAMLPIPYPITPLERKNVTDCCQRQNIPDVCMPLCSFEVSIQEVASEPKFGICLAYFKELIQCASDGADHTLCCTDAVVFESCLPLCRGQIPPTTNIFDSPELRRCVQEGPAILECAQKGYDKIPTAPMNLVASFVANKIKFSWDTPSRNADKVTSYTVHYTITGNTKIQTVSIDTLHGLHHELQGVDEAQVYHVWMTAVAYKFGESQPSNTVSLSASGIHPVPPQNVMVQKVVGTNVMLSWQQLPPESPRAEAFAVYYREQNAVKDQVSLTRDLSVTLTGLKPNTRYTAYVKSKNIGGEGLASTPVMFTTGSQGDTPTAAAQSGGGSSLSGGQVAGIVLAVIAVIIVVIIIGILVMRSRTGAQKLTDTVSFENPGYGDTEQPVVIGNLPSLPGDPTYSEPQPQMQEEKDGNFGYARLNENQMAAATQASNAKPEMDYPNTQYANAVDPSGVGVQLEKDGVATLQVSET